MTKEERKKRIEEIIREAGLLGRVELKTWTETLDVLYRQATVRQSGGRFDNPAQADRQNIIQMSNFFEWLWNNSGG